SGTALGIIMGNILPARIVSALSVALFGMFLAIIIPPAKKDKAIAILIVLSFLSSYLLSRYTSISTSMITIILTIVLSGLGALLFPTKEK
ncbi:MAG: branched-chain amino acid ABC transporter permease, partial [Erysipelotrichaceae bacterium]|nr:branched-chain amino acid ABC transporter permease [Erysipelotrichaceae bacterium]